MTLIAALEGPGGIVLAADSRGTVGDPRSLTATNDMQEKLFRLSDYAGITISGASELAVRLIDRLVAQLKADKIDSKDVDAILGTAIKLMKREYGQWFGERQWVNKDQLIDQRPAVLFITGGLSHLVESTADTTDLPSSKPV